MIVFFEGIDGAGKTTTIEKVKEELEDCGYTVYVDRMQDPRHVGRKKSKENLEIARERSTSKAIWLYDRSPLSDIVYRMWDGKDTGFKLSDVIKMFEKSNCLLVWCDRDPIKCSEVRTITENDDPTNVDDLIVLQRYYNYLVNILAMYVRIPCMIYDVDHESGRIDKILLNIRRKI